jgi:hypothetical protein
MKPRGAAVVAGVAMVGLVVTLLAVWPRLGTGRDVQVPEPGSTGPVFVRPTKAAEPARQHRGGTPEAGEGAGADSRPVRLAIPSIRVVFPVRPVGVAVDGQMQLPADPTVLGWYRFGAPPGATAGAVAIAGHLDSLRFGVGPLVRLRDVEPGARVTVAGSDGTVSTYTVVGLRRFDRNALPARLFGRGGPERLHVITCGGAYDADEGGYEQNLVLTAVPV